MNFRRGEMSRPELPDCIFAALGNKLAAFFCLQVHAATSACLLNGQREGFASILPPVPYIKM
jgi:hypothetical protein